MMAFLLVLSACQHEGPQMLPVGNTSVLFINAKDSRDTSKFVAIPAVTLLKDTDTLKTVSPEFPSTDLWLGRYERGSYKLTYRNIFGQTVSQSIKATGAAIDTIVLYVDKADFLGEASCLIVDRLGDGECFTIKYSSIGCFHLRDDSLTFSKKEGKLIARYKTRELYLSKKQIEAVREFEKQTKLIGGAGCTTVDSYQISYKKEISEFRDGSCKWHGFRFLKKELLGNDT